jgi:hypothetical protein
MIRLPGNCILDKASWTKHPGQIMKIFPSLLLALAMSTMPVVAAAYDYPTVDRVEYVHGCMRDSEAPMQELIYKCSCVIDTIAKEMPYEEYVESTTAANAFSIGGERGETIRAYSGAKKMADKFRALQTKARKSCMMR